MISCPIAIEYDLSMGVCVHHTLNPFQGFPPPGIPTPSIEMLINMMWVPGTFSHKFTKDIFHKGQRIVQEGHDCGALIPDITPMCIVNFYYLIAWPTSKRAVTFGASTVKIDQENAGCVFFYFPMMTCGQPFSLPSSVPLTNLLNNVLVGMTLDDLLAGLMQIAISMALDAIFNKLGGQGFSGMGKAPLKSLVSKKTAQEAAEKAFKETFKKTAKKVSKEEMLKATRKTMVEQSLNALGFGRSKKDIAMNLAKNELSGMTGFIPGKVLGRETGGKYVNIGSNLAGFSWDQKGPAGTILTYPISGG